MFTLAHQWRDKKHRHVFDLCKKLDEAADHIDRLQRMIDEAQISNSNPPERQMPLTDGEMVHPRPAS
jgi:hypothetical protein